MGSFFAAICLEHFVDDYLAAFAGLVGLGFFAYYFGGGLLGWVSAPLKFLRSRGISRITNHGVTMSAHFHWDDEPGLGKPLIFADDDTRLINHVWAMLDIEAR